MDLPSAPSFSAPSFSAPSLSGPFSESDQERMKQEAEEFLDRFGKVYLRSYKTKLIEKVKKELAGEEPSAHKLRQRPEGKQAVVVMSGWLTKRGSFIKNWKRRWFVLKSNGACDYYAKEGDPKPKGSVVLEGYSVNAAPSSDVVAAKPHPLTCEPADDDKRTWYFVADSEEDKATWVAALTQATRVAVGYVNPDAVVGQSFKAAYQRMRSWYGMWYKSPRGVEEEALADMVYDRLYQVVVADVIRDLEGAPLKMAQKFVRTLCSSLVAAAWKALDQATGKLRPTIEDGLKKILGPLGEAERKIKDQIQDKVGGLLNPPVSKVFSPFFAKAVSILYPVLIEAFSAQIDISADKVLAAVSELNGGNSQAAFKHLENTLEVKAAVAMLPHKRLEVWTSKVEQILKVVDNLDDLGGLVAKMRSLINETLKPAVHLVYPPSLEEGMLQMASNTSYTFEMDYTESSDSETSGKGTVAKLAHDLKLLFEEVAQETLKTFVRPPFDSFVAEPAKDLIAPISDTIPEDMKDFIDVEAILDDIMEQTLTDCVNSSAAAGISALAAQLDSVLQKKGISPL